MTPALSAITILLAAIGSISLGVWLNLAVQYFVNKDKLTAEQIENKELRKYLIEVKQNRSMLAEEVKSLQQKYDSIQNTIMGKLLK
jgi:uncharacterized membrane protein (DUF106 family)